MSDLDLIRAFVSSHALGAWKPELEATGTMTGFRVCNWPRGVPGLLTRACDGEDDAGVAEQFLVTASRAQASGVKVFRPSRQEAEILLACDPEVSAADYRQPFTTMFCSVPDGVRDGEDGGCPARWPWVAVDMVVPGTVVASGLVLGLPLHGHGRPLRRFAVYLREQRSLAEAVAHGLPERDAEVIRLALNSGLYLAVKGASERWADPGRVKWLKQRKKADRGGWRAVQAEIRREPLLVEPHRRVEVRPSRAGQKEAARSGRWAQPPHQRRGHFRMQACGRGRAERRLIFVEPYAVSGLEPHDFAGTSTEYLTAGSGPAGEARFELPARPSFSSEGEQWPVSPAGC